MPTGFMLILVTTASIMQDWFYQNYLFLINEGASELSYDVFIFIVQNGDVFVFYQMHVLNKLNTEMIQTKVFV